MSTISSLGPKLPLKYDQMGFTLVSDYLEEIRQNMKNIILTSPGERVMDVNFGAGLRKFQFEHITSDLLDEVREVILRQLNRYLPIVSVREVIVSQDPENRSKVYVAIKYSTSDLNFVDTLLLSI
jgi:phage baseplate assembly protein W